MKNELSATAVKVFDYKTGELLGRAKMAQDDYMRYEADAENRSGAVLLGDWLSPESREDVAAQDDATVWLEKIDMRSQE